MNAAISQSRARFIIALALIAVGVWAALHVVALVAVGSIAEYIYSHWIFLVSFFVLSLSLAFAHSERPTGDSSKTVGLKTTVVVPAYNEDPVLLYNCLASIMEQSRPVQEIYVIDDGSNKSDYTQVHQWFDAEAVRKGIEVHWIRQDNGGKRHAQGQAFSKANDTDIFITVDSDSVLDYEAINEIIRPFSDAKVQSVAGVVLARNNRENLLARVTDLLFVTGQLIDRSMMSSLGSVLVNSGGLAAYRADLVRDNLDAYLHETFFGRHIEFSDDSMLTLYALQRGRTVQQPTAFVFTEMPAKMSHHMRQQLRWMKGSFIRSWWRLKYLPLNSFGFMRQAMGWVQFVVTSVLLTMFVITSPQLHPAVLPYLMVIPVVIGYAQALRYLSVSRSDESLSSQLLTYALTPLAVLWGYVVLRPIRIYASLTCFKPGWGTRESVEVTQVRPSTLQAFVMNEMALATDSVEHPAVIPSSVVLTAATEQSIQAMDAARPRLHATFDRGVQLNTTSAFITRQKLWLDYSNARKNAPRSDTYHQGYARKGSASNNGGALRTAVYTA